LVGNLHERASRHATSLNSIYYRPYFQFSLIIALANALLYSMARHRLFPRSFLDLAGEDYGKKAISPPAAPRVM
jgi:hypothetical protein